MGDIDAVLAAARALRFVREEPSGSNGGQAVEAMLKLVGLKRGDPWCMSLVNYVGNAALGKRWPLPLSGGCAYVGDYALRKMMFDSTPAVGDVFLLYYPKMKRFAHTGFVAVVHPNGTYQTIEGNTSDPTQPATREGFGVFERTRTVGPMDRFIRWAPHVRAV